MIRKGTSVPLITKLKVVSRPLIHEHLMMPWNDVRKGDCCGRFEAITDGFYCKACDFFVHKQCGESPRYIQHSSHPLHTLALQSKPQRKICDLCGKSIVTLFYHCEKCYFNMDISCVMNPPPKVIPISEMHHHKLNLLKERIKFHCNAKCGKVGKEFPYKCHECAVLFHIDCVWNPAKGKHKSKYITMDPEGTSLPLITESEGVSLPLIHEHIMMPWNDLRRGDCCGRLKATSDGYFCKNCDFFVHKKCVDEFPQYIHHPSHSSHTLALQPRPIQSHCCNLCGERIFALYYRCEICDFDVDIFCAKYPPPEVVNLSKMHHHKLTLLKERHIFDCDAKCGKDVKSFWKDMKSFPFKCHECDVSFHVNCVWNPLEEKYLSEVNHTCHPLHPLKLCSGQAPDYSDGKCRICGGGIDDRLFYHCSTCEFSLDLRCIVNPPSQSLLNMKAHDHQLTLLPRLDSFTCNACGLSGDRSPYICVQCDFMIHQECLALPRLININRHDHRVSRTSLLGVMNSICGVCFNKIDWKWGGYSCQRCSQYVVHSKCATRKDVWNGKELEGIPEETEDIEAFVRIDENTIKHFSHNEHYLKFHASGLMWEENRRCSGCNYPICLQPFYGCIICHFFLHKSCAESRKKKWHVIHNDRFTLVTSDKFFQCKACDRSSNGFMYECGDKMKLDVRCGAISEPFIHPGHPHHSLCYIPSEGYKECNGCEKGTTRVLTCIESGCGFLLCFRCATLPRAVNHRVYDHPLSLCYGEKARGKYWCDICEKETNTEKWFYTCKYHLGALHIECVMGDFLGFMPRSTVKIDRISYKVLINNSVSRPLCGVCRSHCIYPIILKTILGTYICSENCRMRFR